MKFLDFDTDQWEDPFLELAMSIKTPFRREIFRYIYKNPGTTSHEIIESLGCSRGRVLRALHLMREAGAIKRVFDEDNYTFYYDIHIENCEAFIKKIRDLLEENPVPEDIQAFIEEKYKKEEEWIE